MRKVFYDLLNFKDKEYVDKIDNHEILGASQQIDIISKILVNMVNENENLEVNKLLNAIDSLLNYYLNSRGNASRAFINSIREIGKNITEDITNYGDLKNIVEDSVQNYKERTDKNLEAILSYSNNELSVYDDIFLFDFSSTVEKAILSLIENHDKVFNIYIAESSAIGGGQPYLSLQNRKNLKLSFFPDAASLYYLRKCQCCLMGAETFYANGSGFNTIGSDMIGHLCRVTGTKLYFITPMNKLDERRNVGIRKEIVYLDYSTKYQKSDHLSHDTETTIPELIDVEPSNIYAYITEFGIIPTDSMYMVSSEYLKNIGGNQ